jgi:hypothetical protein
MTAATRFLMCFVACAAITSAAFADPSNINPSRKFCWGENIGYLNWRDAGSPPASQGARVGLRILSGFVWAENAGWINLGDGTPNSAAGQYGNADGSDCGVNIEAGTGDLFGLAWGENIGWVNFDTRAALGPSGQQARYDAALQRLRGYAWGENVGWINLDDNRIYVSTGCVADFDGNGVTTIDDLFLFLRAWFTQDPSADVDGNNGVTIDDIFVYLNMWFRGC